MGSVHERLDEHARAWGVAVGEISETESSLIAFGTRDDQAVVLKVVKRTGDEWRSGGILDAFGGRGVVRVCEYVAGAAMLERLTPGSSLAALALDGRDDEATEILATVMTHMAPRSPSRAVPTAHHWGKAFASLAANDDRLPRHLVDEGGRLYAELCASETQPRLLHGDLHHYNVLFDRERGWLAIDPKGVIAEREYEIGASLRNPAEHPALFLDPATLERRVRCVASRLNLDAARILAWGFAQAVLSALWSIEDGFHVDATTPTIRLAEAIRPMLPGRT